MSASRCPKGVGLPSLVVYSLVGLTLATVVVLIVVHGILVTPPMD